MSNNLGYDFQLKYPVNLTSCSLISLLILDFVWAIYPKIFPDGLNVVEFFFSFFFNNNSESSCLIPERKTPYVLGQWNVCD